MKEWGWLGLIGLASIGWLWLFWWLRCVYPLAFWALTALLLGGGPFLWLAWRKLWAEYRRDY